MRSPDGRSEGDSVMHERPFAEYRAKFDKEWDRKRKEDRKREELLLADDEGRLYHFTAPTTTHLGAILRSGQIDVTEANITPEGAGEPVVWLTSNGRREGHGWHGGGPKLGARLTVEVPDAEHWPVYARRHGIAESWYTELAAAGNPDEWWVRPRPIGRREIVALDIYLEVEHRRVEGLELRRLFESRGRQRALELPEGVVMDARRFGWPGDEPGGEVSPGPVAERPARGL